MMTRATILGLLLLGLSSPARAAYLRGASGSLTATVSFAQSGTNLLVTLSNTTLADVQAQADVLGAVFFTLAGNPLLTKISAVVPAGARSYLAQPIRAMCCGEWAYNPNLNNAPFGALQGIGSAGYSANAEFTDTMLFPGAICRGLSARTAFSTESLPQGTIPQQAPAPCQAIMH